MTSKSKNDCGFEAVLDFGFYVVHHYLWVRKGRPFWPTWYPTFYKVGFVGRVAKRLLATTTQNTKHKHTTNNMSRRRPTSQRLCPLPPWLWLGQRHPQRMAWRPPMVPYDMVGSLVWGVPNNTRQKIERWMFLGLNSLTAIMVRTGTKNSPPVGFLC